MVMGEVPPARGGTLTLAGIQYAMLSARPGPWTQEEVLLASSPGPAYRPGPRWTMSSSQADEVRRLLEE